MTIEQILNGLKDCIFEELTEYNVEEKVIDRLDSDIFEPDWNTGATKLVLFPKKCNFVIKIPLNGYVYSKKFYEFEGAPGADNCWDYCAVEKSLYETAVEALAEKFFLKLEYAGNVNDYPIYKQVKATSFADSRSRHEYSEIKRSSTREICEEIHVSCFHTCWLSDFLEFYTKEDLALLNEFIEDCGISDLHSGNLGYKENGIPVIIDYAGFWD